MTPVVSTSTTTPQSPQDRIEALKEKYAALERALDEDPFPTLGAVHDLKRQKVRIRDEIYQLERQCHPVAVPWRGSGSVNMSGRPRVRGSQ